MNRIVTSIVLFGLLVCIVCAAPAKKSEDTETKQTEESKQISQQTQEDTADKAEETSKSEDKASNQEVTRYQDIEVDNDSKVTKESEPDKRSQTHQVQKVAEHLLTKDEAITLVTELTDQDYIEQYLYNEGAQGLFQALDLLKDQGWITDIEYTIISDSLYQQILAGVGVPYDIEESASIAESQQIGQPIYNTFSSYQESEQNVDVRLADVVASLLDRVSERQMSPEEGADIVGAMIKILYGLEEQQMDDAYSEWQAPEQFLDLPNAKGYTQGFDIVNSEGKPIGKAQEIVETYNTDDGKLGQELAALEQMQGQFGDNGVFQGQQQTYQKEEIFPLLPITSESSEEEGSGSSSEEEDASFMERIPAESRQRPPWFDRLGKINI